MQPASPSSQPSQPSQPSQLSQPSRPSRSAYFYRLPRSSRPFRPSRSSRSAQPARQRVFLAGAATRNITPADGVFLFGYPHVPRAATGVHDPLETSALYLCDADGRALLFISSDLIFVGKQLAADVRRRVHDATGVPVEAIAVTATHTHSGPVTVDCISNSADPVVPKAGEACLAHIADKMVEAALTAIAGAVPAELGLTVADGTGTGTNRHDPAGPADPATPVLLVRRAGAGAPLACMIVHAMHPTVLHEDSTLISADFPHFTRARLRERGLVPATCPILWHNGASGNQSPRHVARANTFAEARRIGALLGDAIADAVAGGATATSGTDAAATVSATAGANAAATAATNAAVVAANAAATAGASANAAAAANTAAAAAAIAFHADWTLAARHAFANLTPRKMPALRAAEAAARVARARLDHLAKSNAPRAQTRTAECDWFGAAETVVLARAAKSGHLARLAADYSPAEIQLLEIGPWKFVTWPGEFFVEYALEVRARDPRAFVITCANGELQGYIVTSDAAAQNTYEAANALFAPESGRSVVDATLRLLQIAAATAAAAVITTAAAGTPGI
ncbi:MAG: neutral/alkaline non-lysosomal ceramidase N-terminal domain-containing protein [Opitutaceae bacterium]|nr:neutral/alkaline non-lysosomal ceramidase N-terminal domain-containing protein [Opitutaceae bacterium]